MSNLWLCTAHVIQSPIAEFRSVEYQLLRSILAGSINHRISHWNSNINTDELIVTVREFIETAKRAKERQSSLTEYVAAVG